jgi:hypothetical protein
MSGGKGNGHGNGASKSTRAPKRGSEKGAARPDKPDDLPPLRSFRDRLPWLPWALVAVMGVALLALTMNTLDFSRREQLLERRLDIATEESEPPQEQLDALDADGTVSTTTTSEPPDIGEEALARERALELQRLEAELERQAAVLDQRESDLDEREQALATVPTTVDETDGSFGSGVHLVGVEIPLGAYRAQAQAGCRYQKLAADDEVLFADQRLEAGPVSVDIGAEVHRFDSNGCGTWVPLD